MDYKQKIVEKIKKIDDIWILDLIFRLIEDLTKGD